MRQSLSLEEVCLITDLGKTSLYKLINSGELKAHKIGKRTVILKQDMEDFLNNLQAYPSKSKGD